MVQLRYGLVSITGKFRDNNEDNAHVDPDGRFFLVADGMGGQAAGEKASELATDLIPRSLNENLDFENANSEEVVAAIDRAVAEANSRIMALGDIDPQFHQMGTTIVFLVSVGGQFYAGGVGDSRAYRLRGGKLELLTTDHSLTKALEDAGTITAEEAKTHRYRNVLYRYLGTREGSTGTEPKEIVPETGDRYVLCSDGVTDGLKEADLATLLFQGDDPQKTAEDIVAAAEEGGSKDNITCLVIFVE